MREVNLSSYLPEFMQKYKEPVSALEAETPEFDLIWNLSSSLFYNHFISTADEYGISRYERMLDIFPAEEETLENRRQAILFKWAAIMPYTIRNLKKCLSATLGNAGYILQDYTQKYFLNIILINKTDDTYYNIERMLFNWTPTNIRYAIESRKIVNRTVQLYTGVTRAEFIRILVSPAKEDISLRTEIKINMDVIAYEYYKTDYQPKGAF